MQTYKYFLGADIGKTTLAICVLDAQENRLLECAIKNNQQGIQSLLEQLNQLPGFSLDALLICMEHTGIYCQPLVSFFYPLKVALWLQSAVQINRTAEAAESGCQAGQNRQGRRPRYRQICAPASAGYSTIYPH